MLGSVLPSLTHVEPPTIETVIAPKVCSKDNCGRKVFARGLCQRCYHRQRKVERVQRNEFESSTDAVSIGDSTNALGTADSPALPYPDISKDDPRGTEKLIVNSIAQLLQTKRDLDDEGREEMNNLLQMYKDKLEAPDGYYPASWYLDANPVRKLTSEEKITCIRLLPPEISEKLFPNI